MATTVVVVATPAAPDSLVVGDGLPADELHVTLGFYGEAADVGDETIAALREWVDSQASVGFTARVGGVARMGDDDPAAVALLIEAVELADLRSSLEAVSRPDGTHPHFTPHITLGYGVALPDTVPAEVEIGGVQVWVGDEHYPAPEMRTRRLADLDDWLTSAHRRQAELTERFA